jgi:hypothetical protein
VTLAGLRFRHPIDIDGAEREMPCTDCHVGDDSNFPDEDEVMSMNRAEAGEGQER